MRTATNGSDACYSLFFKTVRWAVKSQNIKIYICKGPSSGSHVLVFACRSSALKGRGESQVFHAHAAWFHLLLRDARQRDLWSVLQGQRVCAARLHGAARRGARLLKLCFPPVTSQDQKVPTVCADDRRGNVPPRLLISCRGRSLVRGNAAGGCGAQQQHPPVLTDRLCGRSPWEMFFSDPTRSIYLTHFLWSRCCRSKRWLLFRLVRGRKIDPSVLWVFICPLIHPSEAVSCL